MKGIEDVLRKTIGLDAGSLGSPLIARAVRARMRAIGAPNAADYLALIRRSPGEWRELVESLVVAETWFFREPEQIRLLAEVIRDEWLPRQRSKLFRILSLPCSSGEEPFSLVMAFRDLGLPLERLRIDAVDLSERSLARAARGIYRKNSFRGDNLSYRDRYFHAVKEGYEIDRQIREAVHFHAANLLEATFGETKETYDCVFCRNLLIYFDTATQRRALEKLERLLRPDGLLFVGPAEQPLITSPAFAPVKRHRVLGFRKLPPHSPHLIVPRVRAARLAKGATPPSHGMPSHPRLPHAAHPPSANPPLDSRDGADLELARKLLDAGRIVEAARICEARLKKQSDCAQAYYLLGLLRDAAGDPSSAECYRKALYLEPNHYESLLQMAVLSQKSGDAARARTFKSRALRVKNRA
jgi:chemotaxis protein methyltransferase WspC